MGFLCAFNLQAKFLFLSKLEIAKDLIMGKEK